jgi:hypothetical protein
MVDQLKVKDIWVNIGDGASYQDRAGNWGFELIE